MRLTLTGNPYTQQRHCYFVEEGSLSYILDCGYQRCYHGDELPHLSPEQIRSASYLFLTHSHENQSGGLPFFLSRGFSGAIVTTTETARQLPFPLDNLIILEALSLPEETFTLPGGITGIWGRSGHCSGSAWFRLAMQNHSIFFSGDYYGSARVHACDVIQGISADLAVLDCDYGPRGGLNSREQQAEALIDAISGALSRGLPVLLPVPRFGRGIGILSYLIEHLPYTEVFADTHFQTEIGHLDASALWVRQDIHTVLSTVFIRSIPENLIALGVYFVSDPQLDTPDAQNLADRILSCGGKVIFTGTVEPHSYASLLMHSGQASFMRYGVHCTEKDMLDIAAQNHFKEIIAYNSVYAPTKPFYDL